VVCGDREHQGGCDCSNARGAGLHIEDRHLAEPVAGAQYGHTHVTARLPPLDDLELTGDDDEHLRRLVALFDDHGPRFDAARRQRRGEDVEGFLAQSSEEANVRQVVRSELWRGWSTHGSSIRERFVYVMESNWIDCGGAPLTTLHLPRPFGPYTLLRRLAAGGMAEVYLGRTAGAAGFEKLVAIKRVHPDRASDDGFGHLLVDEAKLSAGLSHRNIVQTLDLRRVDGAYVLVMEHVEGYDAHHVLQALRRAGRLLSVDVAAYIVAEVCRGLDYAHAHRDARDEPAGIVHRDVSPQNVLLSFSGEVKLADFGIAKSRSRRSDPESGVIKGKYFYMSPEQAWAEPLDHRSDIFSAGVVLWELLVGERLHKETHVQSLLDAVRRAQVPPPSSLRAGIPQPLDEIVARATAVRPADRYADAGAMADALVSYFTTREPVDVSRHLGELVAAMPAPPSPEAAPPPTAIPFTRDRVETESMLDRRTPNEPLLRYDFEEGRPTVAGWRRPEATGFHSRLSWALGGGLLLVALTLWRLYGA
jgi:serine/threonine protein kinase